MLVEQSIAFLFTLHLANGITFDIIPNKAIVSGAFLTTVVQSNCMCKSKCLALPQCLAWSVTLNNNERVCRLVDHTPTSSEVVDDPNSILGISSGSTSVTTTTTTTPATTHDPSSYEYRFVKENDCSAGRALSTVSLKPLESKRSFIQYIQCFKVKIAPSFSIDNSNVELVSAGSPAVPPARCSGNRVLIGFKSFQTYTAATGGYSNEMSLPDNPPYLLGICHFLVNWTVDNGTCETITATTTSWFGEVDSSVETEKWDYWFSCKPFYLAVKITRTLVGDQHQVSSIDCCKIH